jgi:hypothetical protein
MYLGTTYSERRFTKLGQECVLEILSSSSLLAEIMSTTIYDTFVINLYEYETLYLIVWEEYILRVFENKVFRKIFGPKKA